MEAIILLLFSSFISIKIHNYLNVDGKEKLREVMYNYFIYIIFNYIFSFSSLVFLFNIEYSFTESISRYRGFGIKYACISIIWSIVLPLIQVIIKNNIKVELKKIKYGKKN